MKTKFILSILICLSMTNLIRSQNLISRQSQRPNCSSSTSNGYHINSSHSERHLSPSNSINTLSGYYVEDFEGTFPPLGWQVIDESDAQYQWTQAPATSHTGNKSAFINFSESGIYGKDWLILPQFSATASDSISFWMRLRYLGYPPDSTYVLVSTTDSSISSFTNIVGELAEGLNYPITATTFEYYSFSLSAFAGQNIYVAIKNVNNFGDGVFIDHVSIGTRPALNTNSVSVDLSALSPSGLTTPLATFSNESTTPQSFPVTMSMSSGYTSTKNITNLAPGTTQQVSFDPTTLILGYDTVMISCQLPSDGYTSDDTLIKPIRILDGFTNYGWRSKAAISGRPFGPAVSAVYMNDTASLYVSGGVNINEVIVGTTVKYAPYTNLWTTKATMTTPAYCASSATINGNVYVIGGFNPFNSAISNNQIYNPVTNIWSAGSNMPFAVGDYALGIYQDSLLYFFGGGDGTNQYDIVQIYNPATDSWTTGTNMPSTGSAWRGGIKGNKIVVTGGSEAVTFLPVDNTYIGTIDPSDPSVITWVVGEEYPGGPVGRHGGGAVLNDTSSLILFTGGDPINNGISLLEYTLAYDVSSDVWKVGPPKPTPVNNLCNFATIVWNDSLYMAAAGGFGAFGNTNANEWLILGASSLLNSVPKNEMTEFDFSVYPNPFNSSSRIKFDLPKYSSVKLEIVDMLGNLTEVIAEQSMNSGPHELNWNSEKLPSGIYFCKMTINGNSVIKKLLKY